MLNAALLFFGFVVWVAVLVGAWRGRRWLLFYILGALGFVVIVLAISTMTGFDDWLASIEARQVVPLANLLGLRVALLGANGLAIKNHTGWGVFDIGVECSGLMEMAAIAGLVLFYPAVYTRSRKAAIVLVAVTATYVFNLLRILLIVGIVANFGTDWVFPAHAVFGRFFFFIATIALYWRLVTVPTVRHVGKELSAADE